MGVRLAPPAAPDPQAVEAFRAARGVAPFGPFPTLLHHPPLLARVEALGRAVRFEGGLPDDAREIAILATAAAWEQRIEWAIHAPIALKAGVAEGAIAKIALGAPPDDATPAQTAAWAFAHELHAARDVSDATFAAALEAFGAAGVVELAVLAGYYAMLAMVMNMARAEHQGTPA